MCGRYYIDDVTAQEIDKLVRQIDEKLRRASAGDIRLQPKDIHPSEIAPVLTTDDRGLCCRWQKWGFPGFQGKQLIFNARSESALEKRTFRDSVEQRRIVVPAAGFYEWSKNKEKNVFYRKGQPVLYMAGFYNRYDNEERFVILTTEANDSMRPVHDRMPLILEEKEILAWLSDDNATGKILQKTPSLLERKVEFEQMSLFSQENSI